LKTPDGTSRDRNPSPPEIPGGRPQDGNSGSSKTLKGGSQGVNPIGSPTPKNFDAGYKGPPGVLKQSTTEVFIMSNDNSIMLKDLSKSQVQTFCNKLKSNHAGGRTFNSYKALMVETVYNQLPIVLEKELESEGVDTFTPDEEVFKHIESWSVTILYTVLTK
jgi:hypothetical protein